MKKTKKPRMSSVDRSIGSGELVPTTKSNRYETAQYNADMEAMNVTGSYKSPSKRKRKKK
jgi:hypothetical protein